MKEEYARTKLPKVKERCPTCKTRLELDIEPFEGTVFYCRKCQKVIKVRPIQQAEGGYLLPKL